MIRIRKLFAVLATVAVALTLAVTASAAEVTDFTDVRPGAWYYDAVTWGVGEGLFAGTGRNTFSPEMPVTRGMFATLLGRQAGAEVEPPAATPFTDVLPSAYYAPYVTWAYENHLVYGTSKTAFSPEEPISREQAVCLFYRYGLWLSMDPEVMGCTDSFTDERAISPYARRAMAWAVGHDLFQGSSGALNPQGKATRTQIAVILQRAGQVLASPETGADSPELAYLKQLVASRLPGSCQWDPRALDAGWYGPMKLSMEGSLSNIAEGCRYTIAKIHGSTYDVYCITEPEPGVFYCYYG